MASRARSRPFLTASSTTTRLLDRLRLRSCGTIPDCLRRRPRSVETSGLGACFENAKRPFIAMRAGVVDKGNQEIGERGVIPQFQLGRIDPALEIVVEVTARGVVGFGP